MNPNCVRKPEQIKLIMECRQSGLSDYQWCQKQGINPGTFYNWVSKLRKAGYTIPDSESKVSGVPVSQEVVKLDLVESETSTHGMMEQNVSHLASSDISRIAAEFNAEISGCASFMERMLLWSAVLFSVSEVCPMLGDISGAANIYIITGYTDMRKSIDGLCAIVMAQLKEEPNGHSIYLFCGKRCDRIKVLLREPDGYVLLYKRLDVVQGKYRWPRNRSEVRSITWKQFDWLMSGLEIEQPKALRTS